VFGAEHEKRRNAPVDEKDNIPNDLFCQDVGLLYVL
jgi:hypothetical protein